MDVSAVRWVTAADAPTGRRQRCLSSHRPHLGGVGGVARRSYAAIAARASASARARCAVPISASGTPRGSSSTRTGGSPAAVDLGRALEQREALVRALELDQAGAGAAQRQDT